MLASGSEADPIVVSDDDEIVSDKETLKDMIQAEVKWHWQYRTDLAGNLWSVKSSKDRRNDFDYDDMGDWEYNDEAKAVW
jgi:hypothetical protein